MTKEAKERNELNAREARMDSTAVVSLDAAAGFGPRRVRSAVGAYGGRFPAKFPQIAGRWNARVSGFIHKHQHFTEKYRAPHHFTYCTA